jgi:hypothetical protein
MMRIFSTLTAWSFHMLSIIAGVSFVVAAGALGWMAADRAVPFKIITESVNRVTVRPGEYLERTVTYVQRKRCWIHSDRMLVDSQHGRHMLEPLEFQAGIGQVGVKQTYVLRIPIPPDMPFGIARFESATVYKCNWLQYIWPIYAPYRAISFEVVPL